MQAPDDGESPPTADLLYADITRPLLGKPKRASGSSAGAVCRDRLMIRLR